MANLRAISLDTDGFGYLEITDSDILLLGGLDSAGDIDLDGTLSFDGAGTIDTSGDNALTIDTGTASLEVTSGEVDLASNVTLLDIPDDSGLKINGNALDGATVFTKTSVDVVFGDGTGDADTYHTHGAIAAGNELIIDSLTTTAMAAGECGYVSANNTITPVDCSSGTGSFPKATFAGVYDGTAGEMVNAGRVTADFDAGLSPAPVAGDAAICSWTNAGKFVNRGPAAGSGHWLTRAGIVLDATLYAGSGTCVIILQPNRPIKR